MLSGVVSSLGIDSRASFKDQAYVLTMGIPITVVFFSTHSVTLMECHNMFVVGYNLSLNSDSFSVVLHESTLLTTYLPGIVQRRCKGLVNRSFGAK